MSSITQLSSLDREKKRQHFFTEAKRQPFLLISGLLLFIYGVIFYYAPLIGWITAFQNYKPAKGLFKSQWVHFENFKQLFENKSFFYAFRNTLVMGILGIVFSFVFAIAFALILNEVKHSLTKRVIQTISYLPHFLSGIILVAIVRDVLASTGIINDLLMRFGMKDAINFFAHKGYFWWIVTFSTIWKETGWNAIIYLSAITSIDPNVYEAADIDGAGRLQQMWYITLPSLRPTIVILLLINIGNVLNVGFELPYLMGNDVIRDVSEVLDTFILKWGISQFNFSIGTAAGIFKSVIAIILVVLANWTAKKTGDERLF